MASAIAEMDLLGAITDAGFSYSYPTLNEDGQRFYIIFDQNDNPLATLVIGEPPEGTG